MTDDLRKYLPQMAFPLTGEGGLVSSLDDLVRWSAAWEDEPFAEIFRRLAMVAELADGSVGPYELGLFVRQYRGQLVVNHSGALPGFKSEFMRFPQQKTNVVCLSNDESAETYAMALRIADILLADVLEPVKPAPPERSCECQACTSKPNTAHCYKLSMPISN